jgi:hypothetical protein
MQKTGTLKQSSEKNEIWLEKQSTHSRDIKCYKDDYVPKEKRKRTLTLILVRENERSLFVVVWSDSFCKVLKITALVWHEKNFEEKEKE